MRTAIAFLLLLFVVRVGSSSGAPVTGRLTGVAPVPITRVVPQWAQTSENGIYSVDISSDSRHEILLGVYRREGDARILAWSKRLSWRGANPAAPLFLPVRRFISNDGNTVILRNLQFNAESLVWISKDADPKRYYPHHLESVLGQRIVDYYLSSAGLDRFEGILEFIYEPKGVFAAWFPALDAWCTIDLKSGELRGPLSRLEKLLGLVPDAPMSGQGPNQDFLTPPSENLTKLLEQEARRRSLAAVRKHQPNFIKTALRPLREKLGIFIPSLKPPPQPSLYSHPETFAGYVFLARRKEPDAEKYIRKLLEYPFRMSTAARYARPPVLMSRSEERMLGDVLWRIWNDVPVESQVRDWPNSFQFPGAFGQPGHYLGGVSGQVQLPMVRPDKAPGNLWVYLIPIERPPGAWRDEDGIVTLFCPLEIGGGAVPLNARPQFDSVRFSIATVTPGEYRLKAVWDRRGPFAPPDGRGVPEPGDYESAESEAFTIQAGTMVSSPVLECVNRIAGADAYYKADETWKRLNPEPRRNMLDFWNRGMLAYDAFPAPHRTWIVKTNTAAKMIHKIANSAIKFKKAEVIRVLPKGDPLERDELFLTFELTGSLPAKARVVPLARDAHGCLFQAATTMPLKNGPSELTVRVPVFPRKEEFTFELRYIPDDTVLCSYTMLNQGPAQKARWHVRPLPIAQQIGGETIRLTQLTRSTGARFEMVSKEQVTLWTPDSLVYQDSEGNRSLEPSDFCKEEKIIKVQFGHGSIVRSFIANIAE